MTSSDPVHAARRRAFRLLHASGCFVLPNPWDVGSARYLQGIGFKALATTSAGFAWAHGRPDGGVTRDEVLAHLREIVAATDLPVNADLESGFAADPEGVEESVRLAVETGVAGLSIEDSTGDPARPIRELDDAVARVRAARAAIDRTGTETLLVGRAEGFFLGQPDLDDVVRRLRAYAAAGADCLYAPGLRTREQIAAVVAAVAPKPVNLLIGWSGGLDLREAAALGVRRVSLGGALARAAWGGLMNAARLVAQEGRFDGLADAAPGAALDALFRLESTRIRSGPMRTYQGGCHCGAVRFEIEAELTRATECNCSICTKKGALHHRVPPERFRLLSGADALTLYQAGTRVAKHWFCKRCGVHPYSNPRAAPEMVSVNLRCLDAYHALRAGLEVRAFDGRNWEEAVKRFTF